MILNNLKTSIIALGLLVSAVATAAEPVKEMSAEDIVKKAFTELFIEQDVSAIDRYWSEDYVQHSPLFPDGIDAIKEAFSQFPPDFKYEMGMIIADDDIVAVHGRFTGYTPKPMIVVDIVRLQDGKIVQHWDVMQEEITDTPHGNPMFEPM